jgi:uncharacterized protein YjbI with pentapeptide repeats
MVPFDLPEYQGEAFVSLDLSGAALSGREFSHCEFRDCNFSGADLSGTEFDDCSFAACNLSNPAIEGTKLMGAAFSGCKLMGINFYRCGQLAFDFSFEACVMRNCNFSELKMKRARFLRCEIAECDFQDAYLVEASFEGSVFRDCLFHNSDLEKASFRAAHGYSIDPRTNKLRKAIFSPPDVLSLLSGFDIRIED